MKISPLLLVLALQNLLVNWAGCPYGHAHIRTMCVGCSDPKLHHFKIKIKSTWFSNTYASSPSWNIKMMINNQPLQQYEQTRCPCTQEQVLHMVVMFFRTLSGRKNDFIRLRSKVSKVNMGVFYCGKWAKIWAICPKHGLFLQLQDNVKTHTQKITVLEKFSF